MRSLQLIKTLVAFGLVLTLLLTGCAKPVPISPQDTEPPPLTAPSPVAKPAPAPAPTPKPTPTPSGPYGELRYALMTFGMGRFEPVRADMTSTGNLQSPMFDHLFSIEGGQRLPGIAERVELAPDGLSWTYYIRKGVRFHNGEDLTAADVKFSIEQYMAKDAYQNFVRDMVDHVDVVDDYTVRVYTKGVQPSLPNMTALDGTPSQGAVMPKDYIEQHDLQYFERHPVGSGPFRFVRYIPGDVVEYEALDKHWRQTPAFMKLSTILMPEEATRIASLKTGAVDLIEISLENSLPLEAGGYKTFLVQMQQPDVLLNGTYDPRAAGMPIADIRVRQALSLAINRDEIRKTFFYGKATPTMPPWLSETCLDIDIPYWLDYSAKAYRYDLQEAQRLLKEAGYPNGFSIKFYSVNAPGAAYLGKLAEVIQGYWAKIGVKAELSPMEQGTYTSSRNPGAKGPAPLLVGAAAMFRTPSDIDTPKRLSIGFESSGTTGMVGTAMPELDGLIRSSRAEMDTSKRREMLAKAIKMAVDSYTVLAIASAPSMGATGPRVVVDFPVPLGTPYIPAYAAIAKHSTQ